MEYSFSSEVVWWITVVDLPALAGLLLLIWRTRQDFYDTVTHTRTILGRRNDQLRDALHAFKLEVAKHYASHNDLRALEARLVEHLLRIESKLESTSLTTEALKAKSK